MIFVTVGTQLPFDRLIQAMDKWAGENPQTPVFAQTGKGKYKPSYLTAEPHLDAAAFRQRCAEASAIVSHAGIGTVLLAMELQKPLVLLPRRADLREHRNDHQIATVRQLEGRQGLRVVYDEAEIGQTLQNIAHAAKPCAYSPWASTELLDGLRRFINEER